VNCGVAEKRKRFHRRENRERREPTEKTNKERDKERKTRRDHQTVLALPLSLLGFLSVFFSALSALTMLRFASPSAVDVRSVKAKAVTSPGTPPGAQP
jgi:hypothetical protein